jgi:hypothetical protein
VRGNDLAAGISSYLADRILTHAGITVRTATKVTALHAGGHLEAITVHTAAPGDDRSDSNQPCRGLFCFVGATPATGWREDIAVDDDGFVLTGTQLDGALLGATWAELGRRPLPFETSQPLAFAIGNVRSGSMKRVSAAVGDGASAIRSVPPPSDRPARELTAKSASSRAPTAWPAAQPSPLEWRLSFTSLSRPLPPFAERTPPRRTPPCPLAAARGCVMPADPVGHGGCRLCRLAGHRIGQYAHFQQCARLVILALILGDAARGAGVLPSRSVIYAARGLRTRVRLTWALCRRLSPAIGWAHDGVICARPPGRLLGAWRARAALIWGA